MFDGFRCGMVVGNKKRFQAPPDPVQLGQSSTNCFAYTLCVHQCLLVVASNKWAAELAELSEADRAWLQANQAYGPGTTPSWRSRRSDPFLIPHLHLSHRHACMSLLRAAEC